MEPCSRPPPSHCGATLLLSLLILALFPYSTTSSLAKGYVDHCESIVPHSTPDGGTIGPSPTYISLRSGFFTGGDELLAPDDDDHTSSVPSLPGYFDFYFLSLHPTRTPGIFKVDGSLYLSGPSHAHSGRGRRRNRHRNFVVYVNGRRTANFDMTGFWSKPLGKICMVGAGHVNNNQGTPLKPTAVLKLNYPQASDISTILVNGSIESLGATDSPAHFRPLSLLAYSQNNNYSYTKIPQSRHSCSGRVDDDVVVPKEVLGLFEDGSNTSNCGYVLRALFSGWFELERGGVNPSCSVLDCRLLGFEPRFMSWSLLGCSEDGKVHMYVTFSRDVDFERRGAAMQTERSFVAEGVWDREKNKLCVLAFPIIIPNNSTVADAFVGGNATVGISLWLPKVLSIEMRSAMVGRIWRENPASSGSLGHSRALSFRNIVTATGIHVLTGIGYLPGVRYEYKYTRTDDANTESCRSSSGMNLEEKGRYPDGSSIGDLRFDLSLTNKEGHSSWGSAVPLSLGENFYGYSVGSFNRLVLDIETASLEAGDKPVLWNVSYMLSYSSFNSSSSSSSSSSSWWSRQMYVEISAEGVYNAETGTICMVGCRDHDQSNGFPMDCEISVSIQLAPLNHSFDTGIHLNGTIRSTRKKDGDPLYFEPLEMSSYSMYATEAAQTIRRICAEIVMVLVSKTLSCVFVVLQLLHAKKRPQALPSVSVGMLAVLALGHLTHLVLNFEALFLEAANKQQDVLLRSGGWLEANEVVVRLTTLLAFLLQLRLLQSAWRARSSSSSSSDDNNDDDDKKKKRNSQLWAAERKALGSYCLPLYLAGALIAWFVHQTRSKKLRVEAPRHGYSVLEDMVCYAGLLLDGFLLPQIVLNAVAEDCTEKPLSPPYYVGMTVVRAFPHVYDAYRRSHYYVPSIDSSIIFATPHEGYYSRAWDIAIPSGGVLFAVLIFFQQKFGGRFFLPKRLTSAGDGYELVSV